MNKSKTLLASTSVALATLLSFPTVSAAADVRMSASGCNARDPHQLDGSHDVGASGWAVTNDTLELVCPIDNSDATRFQDIWDIHVHLFDGSAVAGNFGRTFVCARDPFTTSQDCSPETSAGGSGHKTHVLNFFDIQDATTAGGVDRSDWYYSLRVNLFSNRSVEQALLGYTIDYL